MLRGFLLLSRPEILCIWADPSKLVKSSTVSTGRPPGSHRARTGKDVMGPYHSRLRLSESKVISPMFWCKFDG